MKRECFRSVHHKILDSPRVKQLRAINARDIAKSSPFQPFGHTRSQEPLHDEAHVSPLTYYQEMWRLLQEVRDVTYLRCVSKP